MSFNLKNNLPLYLHAQSNHNGLLDATDYNVNVSTFDEAYSKYGYTDGSSIKLVNYSTAYFGGLWAADILTTDTHYYAKSNGNNVDLIDIHFWAKAGCAPRPEYTNPLTWPRNCYLYGYNGRYPASSDKSSSAGKYIWIAFFDNRLHVCQSTSSTPPDPTAYTECLVSDGCNVIILNLVGAGGGGGGGYASNPLIGYSYASGGGGGGGGGFCSVLYRFNPSNTASNYSTSYKIRITLGAPGTAGGKASDGSQGGTTYAYEYTSSLGSLIGQATGGYGGKGGVKDTTNRAGGSGGLGSATSIKGRSYVLQNIQGRSGGDGYCRKSTSGSGYGGDGECYTTEKFTFISGTTNVINAVNIQYGVRGKGSEHPEYPANFSTFFRCGGGGGGASPFSESYIPNYLSPHFYIGTGGQGGSGGCDDGTTEYTSGGQPGYPGALSFHYNN